MRTILVGDIHGCLDEFQELLGMLAIGPSDRLVLLGDYMDRGPKSVECVRLARESGALAVLGNHDEKHLRWRRHEERKRDNPGYKNPMRPLPGNRIAENEALSDADIAWLKSLPRTLNLAPGWVAVHAGFMPGRTVAEHLADKKLSDQIIRLCWVDDKTDKFVPLSADMDINGVPVGSQWWMNRFDGNYNVVFGHSVHGGEVRIDDRPQGVRTFGIDTGCCFGGQLTAMVVDSEEMEQTRDAYVEFVQVKAKDKYAHRNGVG